MSEKELSFEELTGTSSVDEWQQENTDAELSKVSAKAQEQLDLENEIKNLEQQLKETKDRHRAVSELELPEAMQEANLAEIVLTSGAKISVKPFYKGYISEDHRDDAMAWLVDNNQVYEGLNSSRSYLGLPDGEESELSITEQSLYTFI